MSFSLRCVKSTIVGSYGLEKEQNCSEIAGVKGQGEDQLSECEARFGSPLVRHGWCRSRSKVMQMQAHAALQV